MAAYQTVRTILVVSFVAAMTTASLDPSKVAEYYRTKSWRALRKSLEDALDRSSSAYEQLQNIGVRETEPMRYIGEYGLTSLASELADVERGAGMSDTTGLTMLHGAAIGGKTATAEALLDRGADIEARDNYGSTPIVLAAKHGHMAMVSYLKNQGADVNGASYYGWTPLYWATDNGNLDMVRYLVDAGANIGLRDRDDITPLDLAHQKGHTAIEDYLKEAQALASTNVPHVNQHYHPEGTVKPEEKEASQRVIAAVFDINCTVEFHGDRYQQADFLYKDHTNETEASKKLLEEVKQLRREVDELKYIKNGDYPKATTLEEQLKWALDLLAEQLTIKDLVEEYNHTKDWRKLRKDLGQVLNHGSLAYKQLQAVSPIERYPPWQIGYDGHAELAMVLVWAGRGLDMRDGSGDNLLHGAVAGGKVMLVRDLLDSGADIESRNSWGNAPMSLACKYRRLGVARLLLARGADIDGINYDEKWAGLARAADNGDLEIVKFMVEAGASTTILDREGRTPLEVARRKGFTNVVEYLSRFPH